MKTIADWNGESLEVAESSGGVLAVVEPLRSLVRGSVTLWPPPEIVQKLYKSRQQRAFAGEDLAAATSVLGFYSDLQSLHSEDAITWSVFGTIANSPNDVRVGFVEEVFSKIAPTLPAPSTATISLWRRIPHPDTLVSGGPEIDFLILTDRVLVLGEAKWLSSVGRGQGASRCKSQIDLRVEFVQKYGAAFFPSAETYVVLGASLGEPVVDELDVDAAGKELLLRDLSWSELCSMRSHPQNKELMAYVDWKIAHSRIKNIPGIT